LATGKSRPYPLSIVIDDLTSSPSTRRRSPTRPSTTDNSARVPQPRGALRCNSPSFLTSGQTWLRAPSVPWPARRKRAGFQISELLFRELCRSSLAELVIGERLSPE